MKGVFLTNKNCFFLNQSNQSIHFKPISFHYHQHWIKSNQNLDLSFFTSATIPVKIFHSTTQFKIRYQNTQANTYSALQTTQTLPYRTQKIIFRGEIKSSGYIGAFPFPFSIEWRQKSIFSTLFAKINTYNVLNLLNRWSFSLGSQWNLGKHFLLKNQTYLPFKKGTPQNNIFYRLQINGVW